MVRKDEVVEWFQKQSGAGRLDAMCTLLDMCLPFEIRFLGSVMENLGRRDFHELNGVSYSANGFLSGKNTSTTTSAKEALVAALLNSPGVTSQTPVNPSGTPATCTSVLSNKDASSSSPAAFPGSEVSDVSARRTTSENTKDSIHSGSSSLGSPLSPHRPQSQDAVVRDEIRFSSSVNEAEERQNADKPVVFPDSSMNPIMCLDKGILEDETLRRKLILYLSLLTATNRECASAYYKVLLDSQKFLEAPGWLAGLSSDTLEEYSLLFTIAVYHPVFTFEQKRILSEILQRFVSQSDLVQRNIEDEDTKFYAAPVQPFVGEFGPFYMYFSPSMPAVGWSNTPSANMSNMNIGGNPAGEDMQRFTSNTAPGNSMTFTVPHFPHFPVFIHHQPGNRGIPPQQQTAAPVPVPQQFPPQTFSAKTPMSPQSSMGIGPAQFPHPCAYQTPSVVPSSVPSHNHLPMGQVVPPPAYSLPSNGISETSVPPGPTSIGVEGTFSLSNKSPSLPQLSQQSTGTVNISCRSNSSTGLLSNTAHSHNTVPLRDAGVSTRVDDNESEENYESTEGSPYGSPPQSLTPSRSHSPVPLTNFSRNQISTTQFVNSETSQSQNDHHRPSTLSTVLHQGITRRSVSSAATSISPPPRVSRNAVTTKVNQVVQVQSPHFNSNSCNVEAAISCLDSGKSRKSDILAVSASSQFSLPGGSVQAVTYATHQDNQVPVSSTISGAKIDSEKKRISQYPCHPEYVIPGAGPFPGNTPFNNSQGLDAYRRQQMNNHVSISNAPWRPGTMSQVTSTSGQYFPQTSSPSSVHSVQVPKVGNTQIPQSYNFYAPTANPVYYQPQPMKNVLHHQQPSSGANQNLPNVLTGRLNSQANGGMRESSDSAQDAKSGMGVTLSPVPCVGNASSSGSSPLNGFNNVADNPTQLQCALPSGSANVPLEPSQSSKQITTLPNHAVAGNSGLPRNRYILDIGGAGQELKMEPTSQFFGTVEDIVDGLNRPKKSCYNCGSHTHLGSDCREKTMEDMTKGIYRINFEATEPTLIAPKQKE